MFAVNTDTIPGYKITQVLGIVRGNTVRAKHVGKDIVAGLKSIVGGEISEYTELLSDAREQALTRMVEHAQQLGAHGVVNVRFVTSMVSQQMSEILAYGTAVVVDAEAPESPPVA
ncbi:MAG TPA: YbjQ family protein [Armatimonadota bacterium]|nr:YbjQ family protein [Armatimonadota bacterium]